MRKRSIIDFNYWLTGFALTFRFDFSLSNSVRVLYSGSIFITYALSCYVAFDILWINSIKQKIADSKNLVFWEYIVRTGIASFTCKYYTFAVWGYVTLQFKVNVFTIWFRFLAVLMAYAVPNLELFISFIGAFCLSTMGIAFPAIVQILTHWCNHEDTLRFTILVFKNFILILIAIFAFTIGVSTTIKQYIEKGAWSIALAKYLFYFLFSTRDAIQFLKQRDVCRMTQGNLPYINRSPGETAERWR